MVDSYLCLSVPVDIRLNLESLFVAPLSCVDVPVDFWPTFQAVSVDFRLHVNAE